MSKLKLALYLVSLLVAGLLTALVIAAYASQDSPKYSPSAGDPIRLGTGDDNHLRDGLQGT